MFSLVPVSTQQPLLFPLSLSARGVLCSWDPEEGGEAERLSDVLARVVAPVGLLLLLRGPERGRLPWPLAPRPGAAGVRTNAKGDLGGVGKIDDATMCGSPMTWPPSRPFPIESWRDPRKPSFLFLCFQQTEARVAKYGVIPIHIIYIYTQFPDNISLIA